MRSLAKANMNPSANRRHHPHAVIVGVGPGLGSALARRFSREGFALTLVARNSERLEALAEELRSSGGDATAVSADAADPRAFRMSLQAIADSSPAPSVLIYNAALLRASTVETATADELATAYAVDVIGAIVSAQVFLPGMKASGGGTIIFTSGSAAIRPSPGIATVSLGKAALRSAASMLASDVADDDVQVVSVTISGAIKRGSGFDPDQIADRYLELHRRPRSAWTAEEPYDGSGATR